MELKGDMNLQITDPLLAHLKLSLAPLANEFGNDLQFRQHPNVSRFVPGKEKEIALKDPSRPFPVGQAIAVLKWRYAGKDESCVPLSSGYISRPVVLPLTQVIAFSQLLANGEQQGHVRSQY